MYRNIDIHYRQRWQERDLKELSFVFVGRGKSEFCREVQQGRVDVVAQV